MLDGVEYEKVKRYTLFLPPERQEKIDRLRFEKDKLLSLVAGLMIRDQMGDLPLNINEHGKPYAMGSDRFFSVSHSGECVAIGVDDREIGVDVEKLSQKDFMRIAQRFYHLNELEYVQNASDRERAFTRIWTRKEAYLKQIGIGIATDLKAFDTTSGELGQRIASFDIDGYVISVCAENTIDENGIDFSNIELNDLLPNWL